MPITQERFLTVLTHAQDALALNNTIFGLSLDAAKTIIPKLNSIHDRLEQTEPAAAEALKEAIGFIYLIHSTIQDQAPNVYRGASIVETELAHFRKTAKKNETTKHYLRQRRALKSDSASAPFSPAQAMAANVRRADALAKAASSVAAFGPNLSPPQVGAASNVETSNVAKPPEVIRHLPPQAELDKPDFSGESLF